MKAAGFEYVRVNSLAEAVEILTKRISVGDDAQVMAGGQSLLAMMNLRVSSPSLLVDISRLEELRATADEGSVIRLGACTTHAAIEDGAIPDPSKGLMRHVAGRLAYRAVRTQGTLGGSLALSDPAADWVTVMPALDAQLTMVGPKGRRQIDASRFTTGVYETARDQDEIIESVSIPKLSSSARWGFMKFCRKSGEFATSLVAVVADPSRNYARVVLGAVSGPPIVLARASQALQQNDEFEIVVRAAEDDLDACGDNFDGYQRSLHGAMATRAIAQVLK